MDCLRCSRRLWSAIITVAIGIQPVFHGIAMADDEVEIIDFESIQVEEDWNIDEFALAERGVNGLTSDTIEPGSLFILIAHRTRQSLAEGGLDDYLGFDAGGLKIGLGLRYGLGQALDLGCFRLNGTAEAFDTYEFDVRYRLLSQDNHGMDLAIRPGVSFFLQPDDDAAGAFAQILFGRSLCQIFKLDGGVLYHSESSGDRKSSSDDDYSVAAQILADFRLTPRFAIDAELVASLGGYGEDNPAASLALRLFTYGHTFSLVISNTQYISADGIVTNAWRDWDDPILGFTITREIEL